MRSLIEEGMEVIGEGNTNQSGVVASCFTPEQNGNEFALDEQEGMKGVYAVWANAGVPQVDGLTNVAM